MTVNPEASSERPDTVLAPDVSLRGTFFPSTRTPRARAGAPGQAIMFNLHELLSPTGAYPVAYPYPVAASASQEPEVLRGGEVTIVCESAPHVA
jgi:hypothetical protein